jgi:hypothetical protein
MSVSYEYFRYFKGYFIHFYCEWDTLTHTQNNNKFYQWSFEFIKLLAGNWIFLFLPQFFTSLRKLCQHLFQQISIYLSYVSLYMTINASDVKAISIRTFNIFSFSFQFSLMLKKLNFTWLNDWKFFIFSYSQFVVFKMLYLLRDGIDFSNFFSIIIKTNQEL